MIVFCLFANALRNCVNYKRIFPAAWDEALSDKIIPEYMAISQEPICQMKISLLGDVEIIILIRGPVEQLCSQARMVAHGTGRDPADTCWDTYTYSTSLGASVIYPSQAVRIVTATKPVGFRKGYDGLAALAERELGLDPHSGIIVVFRAKRDDRIKELLWNGSGFALCDKRLEQGKLGSAPAECRMTP